MVDFFEPEDGGVYRKNCYRCGDSFASHRSQGIDNLCPECKLMHAMGFIKSVHANDNGMRYVSVERNLMGVHNLEHE